MSDTSENLIEIRDLKYSRGARVIFNDLNLTIKRGEVTALMGPSGTGKTTLLRLITRQLIPQQGVIFVDGIKIIQVDGMTGGAGGTAGNAAP
ncbi:MAG: ATP-binding cassette domain-containing protein, partial [Pseudomonadota bacterium]